MSVDWWASRLGASLFLARLHRDEQTTPLRERGETAEPTPRLDSIRVGSDYEGA